MKFYLNQYFLQTSSHKIVRRNVKLTREILNLDSKIKYSIIEPHTITELHVSDHFYIDCRLNLLKPRDVKTTYISRNYRSINSDAFGRDLASKLGNLLSQDCTDIDSLVRCYNQTCTEVLDAHAPATVRPRTIRRKPLWFNEVVEDARRVRRRCERKSRKSHSEVDQEVYFDAQKTVSTLINNAKTEYYTEKLSACDSKCMFKVVNELLIIRTFVAYLTVTLVKISQINSVIFSITKLTRSVKL